MSCNEHKYVGTSGTQKNITTLKDYGYKFVEPKIGKLACGIVGNGNLASVETIIETIIKEISQD